MPASSKTTFTLSVARRAILLVVLLTGINSLGLSQNDSVFGRNLVELNLYVNSNKQNNTQLSNASYYSYINRNINFAFSNFVSKNLALGAIINYSKNDYSSSNVIKINTSMDSTVQTTLSQTLGGGAKIDYYFVNNRRWLARISFAGTYFETAFVNETKNTSSSFGQTFTTQSSSTAKGSGKSASITPTLFYRLNKFFLVNLSYGNLFYVTQKSTESTSNNQNTQTTSTNSGVNLNGNTFQIGLSFIF